MPQGPLVAIVDDDEAIRDTTKDLLESAGFSAVVFARAASLLKSRRLNRVRCLITDMRMPKMTGLELLLQLAASDLAQAGTIRELHFVVESGATGVIVTIELDDDPSAE